MRSSISSQGWQYSTIHNSVCKVIEEQTLWGQTVCRIWLPNQDVVVRVPRAALRSLSADLQPEIEAERIAYVAAAAKVAEVLEGAASTSGGHVLLAPMESNVIPLPHQIHALSRVVSGDRVRYLLADEVGGGNADSLQRAFPACAGRRHRHAAPYGLRDGSAQLGLVDVRSGYRLFGFGQAHGQAARLDRRAHSRLQPQPV